MKAHRISHLSIVLFFLLTGPVLAHDAMSSWAVAELRANSLALRITLGVEAVQLLLDRPVGPIDDSTASLLELLKTRAGTMYQVSADGTPLIARAVDVHLEEEDGVEVLLVYPRPERGPLRFEVSYLKKLPSGHRTSLTLLSQAGQVLWSQLLRASNPVVEMTLPAGVLAPAVRGPSEKLESHAAAERKPIPNTPASELAESETDRQAPNGSPAATDSIAESAGPVEPPAPLHRPSFGEFLQLGIEHILTGYDHLLFLCGLLVVCRRFSSIAAIITCFTIAHSLTLGLASLQLVAVPGRIVEPMIAATIVFVGVENLMRKEEPKGRWALTFVFGLIHGFGFASVLKQIGLGTSGSDIIVPLFSFNLGVEVGQIGVTAIFLPILWKLGRLPGFARGGRFAISAAVVLVGVYWFTQRILS